MSFRVTASVEIEGLPEGEGRYDVTFGFPIPDSTPIGQVRGLSDGDPVPGFRLSAIAPYYIGECMVYIFPDVIKYSSDVIGEQRIISFSRTDASESESGGESESESERECDAECVCDDCIRMAIQSSIITIERDLHWNCDTCINGGICGCGCDPEHDGWTVPGYWLSC